MTLPATKSSAHFGGLPDVPILLLGSWNDPYARNMLEMGAAIRARNKAPLRQIFGPWLHGRRSTGHVGEADFGMAATIDAATGRDWVTLRLDWFDHALGRGPAPLQRDLFWQMQAGLWPSMGGGWQSHRAPHRHSVAGPPGVRHTVTIDFDPSNPHPTPGGAVPSGGSLMAGGMFDQRSMQTLNHPGSVRLTGLPLPEDLVLTDLTVCATGTAELPFDLHAMLVEELPCGAVINITDGILRRSTPGAVAVELAPTSYKASRGNRLGLVLARSNFPRHDFVTHQPWSLHLTDVAIMPDKTIHASEPPGLGYTRSAHKPHSTRHPS
ncbi:hypothetical protein E4L95_03150 [Paracoccus liaowanqingii]|uniref:Xaa-Pro dipeptidyl-peptidase C-terminal domain-containing protein n=1 Tax=Paracoccus liaowanqingii TaxID=2560053 RepID=A0A4Z1CRS2_9RHOB|nr:hypothetical protein [Paracoccus liaowanqingii]TGN67945.1 hypothetical protein E4L95_03150 [Paracoccus liaowanqingii]